MKPPPRKRTKPSKDLPEAPTTGRLGRRWPQQDMRKLLTALTKLSAEERLEPERVRELLPSRTAAEINLFLEALKEKVIVFAQKKESTERTEEQRPRKPLEMWIQEASAVSGEVEETLSSAFTQMLTVTSIEPCVPPQPQTPAQPLSKASSASSRLRSPPSVGVQHVPVKEKLKKTCQTPTGSPLPTPASSVSPLSVKRTPPSSGSPLPVRRTPTSARSPLSVKRTPTSSRSPRSVKRTPPSSGSLRSVRRTPPSSGSSRSARSPSSSGSSRSVRRTPLSVSKMNEVSFEKIYHYLSTLHKPSEQRKLTPMESAVVLDLLMSLPEELLLLDCDPLRQHLSQVYLDLSTHKDSRRTEGFLKGEKQKNSPGASDPQWTHPQRSSHPPLNPFRIPVSLLSQKTPPNPT